MGAICGKCCLCYCLKMFEFGERFRCGPLCRKWCEFCQCGDCCDVDEDDYSPFMDVDEAAKEGQDAMVYPNGEKYIGQFQNNKRHGYGELIRPDGTRLKGYFIEDEFVGEMTEAAKVVKQSPKESKEAEPSSSRPGTSGETSRDHHELQPVT